MKKTVLVVDDSLINRQIIKKILSDKYLVVESENGKEALKALTENQLRISAILLDIVMPIMDGYEFLKKIKSNSTFSQIPVIVTTGNTEVSDEKKALALGANDFVTKPFNAEILITRLNNLIKLRETSIMINTLQRDKLTGLWNREAFFQKVEGEIKRKNKNQFILACIDIDSFKLINDQYGTYKGDTVLKLLANNLRKKIESKGGICGRISADTFVVLCTYVDDFDVDNYDFWEIKQINKELSLNISISIGYYVIDDRKLAVSTMYDRAKIALKKVKGRYDVHIAKYDDTLLNKLIHDQEIVSEMKNALEEKQFEAWYQPQYNHVTGAIIGAEALVRWNHPLRGLIFPNEFIPVFENNGFIYELDKFIWEEVCIHLRKWIDEGRNPLPISVNISRYDLFQENLVEKIISIIKKYDISCDLLRLEITESVFSDSTKRVVNIVKELIDYGFTVEIDDFGSGYSSLNTLKDVPAQIVKLDMRFFEGTDNLDRGGNILQSIVRMAKWIDMIVIAEGVEEIAQADYLKSIGCNYIQGYLYNRPMPCSDYEKLAKKMIKEERLIKLETVENMDNNSFWNPKSLDTLIFNSYVGAACILEYSFGSKKIEVIRSTDRFVEMIGVKGMTISDILKVHWEKYLDDENVYLFDQGIKKSLETSKDITVEIVFNSLPWKNEKTYIRSTLRVIASVGEKCLVYDLIENTTVKHEMEHQTKEAASLLMGIMENVDSGISAITIGIDGNVNFLFANEKYYEIFGYTRKQFNLEVRDSFNLVYYEDRERIRNRASNVLLNRSNDSYEYRCVKRNKELIYIRCNSTFTRIVGVEGLVQLSVISDITDSVLARKKEQESTVQLRAIMDNMNGGISITKMNKENKLEYIFTNDKYYQMFGYTKFHFSNLKGPFDIIVEEDLPLLIEKVNGALKTKQSTAHRYRCKKNNGEIITIRAYFSVLDLEGYNESVILCIITDISDMANSEQKIVEADEQLRFINQISKELLVQPEIEEGINNVLRKILEYFDAKKTYIVEKEHNNQINIATYEYCTLKDKSILNTMTDDADSIFEKLQKAFRLGKFGILENDNTKKRIVMPFFKDNILVGFLAIDEPNRNEEQLEQLKTMANYLTIMITRRDLITKIKNDNEAIKTLMDDTPGGFSRVQILPDGTMKNVFANKKLCQLRGMTFDEIIQENETQQLSSIHPDDVDNVRKIIKEMIESNNVYNAQYRIKKYDGTYIPLNVFARITKNEQGKFINVYYTEMPENDKKELSIKETMPFILSAIMNSSINLEFAKDKDYRYICCSKAFAEFVGQKDESHVVGKTDFDLFPINTAKKFRNEDEELFKKGTALIEYTEKLPSTDGIQHYFRTSKYSLRDSTGEIIGIYGNGRDITDVRIAFERLKLLTDTIPGGIASYVITDNKIDITYFNDGFCKILGCTREQYEKITKEKGITSNVFDADKVILQNKINIFIKNNEPIDCIYRVKKFDETGYIWVNLRCLAVDRNVKSITCNAVLYDITAYYESKKAL